MTKSRIGDDFDQVREQISDQQLLFRIDRLNLRGEELRSGSQTNRSTNQLLSRRHRQRPPHNLFSDHRCIVRGPHTTISDRPTTRSAISSSSGTVSSPSCECQQTAKGGRVNDVTQRVKPDRSVRFRGEFGSSCLATTKSTSATGNTSDTPRDQPNDKRRFAETKRGGQHTMLPEPAKYGFGHSSLPYLG